jgi:hypothetical protein
MNTVPRLEKYQWSHTILEEIYWEIYVDILITPYIYIYTYIYIFLDYSDWRASWPNQYLNAFN